MTEKIQLAKHLSVDIEPNKVAINQQNNAAILSGDEFEQIMEGYLRQRRLEREEEL